jgi:Kinesin motor domain
LLSLTEVIRQLSLAKDKQPKYINYRDSKLTRLLQPHLSGNAAISIICCCSAAKKSLEETRSTLKFAFNAKRIKLKPQVNEIVDDRALIDNLKRELQETRRILKEMREYKEKNPPMAASASPSGPEFPLIERFLAQMNMSVKTVDFQDAMEMEELSGSSADFGENRSGVGLSTALSVETDITGPIEAPPRASAEPADGEEDEDDIEAFRRQILAKFMNMTDDDDMIEEDGDNADTTMNDTTMGDTTVNDTTTDYDTSVNRTLTDDSGKTRESIDNAPNKENQPEPESPPAISRKETPVIERKAPPAATQKESNASEVFRSKPGAELGVKPDAATLPLVSPATNVFENHMQVGASTPDDSYSNDTSQRPPDESDLNLIEKFRAEILEKFRDEIVDEEAAHELDENAQNVAVIANELINKFRREIVYKFKDDFPEILTKRVDVDVAATRVGDNGIVGRVIERDASGVSSSVGERLNTDESSSGGSVENFEDEFDDEAQLGVGGDDDDAATADAPPRDRHVPSRSYSTQTDRAVINGKALLAGTITSKVEAYATEIPVSSSVGRGTSGSVSSDLSSEVADKDKEGSGASPVPANPPDDDDDEDYMIPPGEIAVNSGHHVSATEGKLRIKFLEEKLLATDELVETLFVELENAKTFIRELMVESTRSGTDSFGAGLFGAGTSGVTVVDEQILNQCEILKFAIYTSLLFFVFGQHELFLATVFFLWLSLEVATKT